MLPDLAVHAVHLAVHAVHLAVHAVHAFVIEAPCSTRMQRHWFTISRKAAAFEV
jgi:hypothetical protein